MMDSCTGQGLSTLSRSVSEQELTRLGANRQQQTTPTVSGPQQELLLQQRQLLDQRLHRPRQQPRLSRDTYKSCDFCAKRKRKCSGGLPRCSLCIEKKQPYCHYQLKPPTKTRRMKQTASRRGFGTKKRLVDIPEVNVHTSELGMTTVAGVRSTAMVPGTMTLKRCRLSPSLATGLVGMQENVFLCDFFGCLGLLPLATESQIRQAMVELLQVVSTPDRPEFEPQLNRGRFDNVDAMVGGAHQVGSGLEGFDTESEGEGWGGSLACATAARSPTMCMMWCAIALGSLMRGAPFENVSEYVRLAQESLSECFDESSVENARAFAMMSFLYGTMGDTEKNEKYLSFATNIVMKLKEDAPEELSSMLVTIEEAGILWNPSVRKAGGDVFIDVGRTADLPAVETIVQQRDICNLFLVTDRRLKQSLFIDMLGHGVVSDTDEELDGEWKPDPDPLEEPHQEKRVGVGTADGTAHQRPGEGGRDREPQPLGAFEDFTVSNGWGTTSEPPPAGGAIRSYIQEVLPELERLSKKLFMSGTFSGVGGLLYHSDMAYMQSVAGQLEDAFKSLEAYVDVMVRYPGTVRYRVHLVHTALAVSHCNNRRDVYEAVRQAYNSVRRTSWKYVKPFEKWASLNDICDHVFCRSAQALVDNRRRAILARCHGAVPTPSSSSSPASTRSSSEHRPQEDEPRQGVQQVTSVSPPIREGSNPPPQNTPQYVTNDQPAAAAAAAADAATAGAHGQSVLRHLPEPESLATDACMPQFLASASSVAVDVGDPRVGGSSVAADEQNPIAGRASVVPVENSTLEPGLQGGDVGPRDEEMRLTGEDLLDAAAAFLGAEELLEGDLLL